MKDLIIAGSGPAGLSAAVYASNAMLDFVVIEKFPVSGGQMLNTYDINNYLGFESVDGFTLGTSFRSHAEKAGARFINDEIAALEKIDGGFRAVCAGGVYEARSVILATGAVPRKLGVKGETEFAGRGVSYCATCDGSFFRGQKTAVVGGGDVALEDALYLSNICEKVYLIHRRDELRGAKYLQDRVLKNDKIEVLFSTQVISVNGGARVSSLTLDNGSELEVGGVFIAVGIEPMSELAEGVAELENGFVVADESCRTSAEGFFAAGDVRTKPLRQIITAAADGANAVRSAEDYLYRNK